MASASGSVPLKELDDITECPICVEVLTNARVLSCTHTFCLRCLEDYAKRSQQADKLACPLCRQESTIPEGGLGKLPKNFFLEKILDVKSLASKLSTGAVYCELCSDETDSGSASTDDRKAASVYCMDCGRNMCASCRKLHQKLKGNDAHIVMDLNKQFLPEDMILKLPENLCDIHKQKPVELFCFECKQAVCIICYVDEHKEHNCLSIEKVAKDLDSQLDSSVKDLAGKDDECKKLLEQLAADEKKFLDQIGETEQAINQRTKEMQDSLEKYRLNLITKVEEAKKNQMKQTQTYREEIERHSVVVKNLIKYAGELKAKGTACDIAKSASSLCERAKELSKVNVETDLMGDYITTRIQFTPKSNGDSIWTEAFGELSIDVQIPLPGDIVKSGKLLHTIPSTGHLVAGLASLNDELFAVRWGRAQVDVYDVSTFALRRSLPITGCSGAQLRGLAACDVNNCLYISEQSTAGVYKMLLTDNSVTQWSVAALPFGLSVNAAHNVLVACYGTHKVQEYTTDGVLVRDINLQPAGITNPLHVIQLRSGHIGVTYPHRFCVVDASGQLMKSFGGQPGSGQGQLNAPRGIAVDNQQRVFIADCGNHRIQVLNQETMAAEQLPTTICGTFQNPDSLYLDASRGRLYIGEWSGGRILCCGSGK